jgi:hypothetical protein
MKGSLGPNIFVHQADHILTHLKIVSGKLYPKEFPEVNGVSYKGYRISANKRDLSFELSESSFNSKIKEPCYLCGKRSSDTHQNGIDRYDNTQGYTEENTKCCCSGCNFMKRSYTYSSFIEKLKMIYHYQQKCPIPDHPNKECRRMVPGNKLSKEQQEENRQIRKKNTHDTLFEKYIDEEKKKEWIADIVRKRKDKLLV